MMSICFSSLLLILIDDQMPITAWRLLTRALFRSLGGVKVWLTDVPLTKCPRRFGYRPESPILEGLSLIVPAGESNPRGAVPYSPCG